LNMTALLSPAFLRTMMVVTWMRFIITKRMSAIVALIAVPIFFGITAGAGPGLGKMTIHGVLDAAPTTRMLAFAVLYFAVMMDARLFEPLVRRGLAWVSRDPMRMGPKWTAAICRVVRLSALLTGSIPWTDSDGTPLETTTL